MCFTMAVVLAERCCGGSSCQILCISTTEHGTEEARLDKDKTVQVIQTSKSPDADVGASSAKKAELVNVTLHGDCC